MELAIRFFSVAEDEFDVQIIKSRNLKVKKQKLKVKVKSLILKVKIPISFILIIKVLGSGFEFH